jgi:hypothetical protein
VPKNRSNTQSSFDTTPKYPLICQIPSTFLTRKTGKRLEKTDEPASPGNPPAKKPGPLQRNLPATAITIFQNIH